VSMDEAEFTWQPVPGAQTYQVKENRWDGAKWTTGEWVDVGNVTSKRIPFAGATALGMYVAAKCSGTLTVPASNSVFRGTGTLVLPNLGSDWMCTTTSAADNTVCTSSRFFSPIP